MEHVINVTGDVLSRWFKVYDNRQQDTGTEILLRFHFPKEASLEPTSKIKHVHPKQYYSFGQQLGVGSFGYVCLATHKVTRKKYAVKIIIKEKLNQRQHELLQREIAVMSKLHHPNIVDLVEAYVTPKKTYLVLEYVEGGSMLKELMDNGPYTEKESARLMKVLLETIQYMNSRGVAHRDLKPDNLLITKDRQLKVSDFGLSKDFSNEEMVTSVGTACYVAPEVLSGRTYGTTCDIWSCGVIAYILLSAQMPFHGNGNEEIFEKIKVAEYTFPAPYFEYVSIEALDFIDKILVPDLNHRMTIEHCLEHPWMRRWHPDLDKKYRDKYKAKRKPKDTTTEKDRLKYTEKPIDAVATNLKVSTRPPKDSIATTQEYNDDDDDDGFPPLLGNLPPLEGQPPLPTEIPPELPGKSPTPPPTPPPPPSPSLPTPISSPTQTSASPERFPSKKFPSLKRKTSKAEEVSEKTKLGLLKRASSKNRNSAKT
eukprot:TRINITY_DN2354_c0_g2_i5.p1 TRINITY_DN2354_c0_g2~~TRINITY_DN2354_c0_g2_i5.p1  ORF type:complete len:482 (-),score=126.83 TRINITY_DN2354_c0_g2_i5:202-1647(-)